MPATIAVAAPVAVIVVAGTAGPGPVHVDWDGVGDV